MNIEELEDKKLLWSMPNALRDEPLLEYIWEVALEFAKIEDRLEHETFETTAPHIFVNRYAESKLTDEERYYRFQEMFFADNISFEQYTNT